MYVIIVLQALLHVCCCVNTLIEPVETEHISDKVQVNRTPMNATLYRTVKRYHCGTENIDDSYLLIYGSKGWSFPNQDVNVTFAYPTAHTYQFVAKTFDEVIIVGFKVNLYFDGSHSVGYISGGGIYEDSIALTFICSNISKLSYQFWLYGVTKRNFSEFMTINKTYKIC